MNTVSYSGIRAFLGCKLRWKLRYVDRLESIEAAKRPALTFGRKVHEWLERYYRSENPALPELEDAESARLRAVLESYLTTWQGCDWIEAEAEVDVRGKISESLNFFGIIDAIATENASKNRVLIEHKTCANITFDFVMTLRLDLQTSLYLYFRPDLEGKVFNILRKPSSRWIEPESDDDFAARKEATAAKNKSGKTNITQRKGETIEEYYEKCSAELANIGPSAFERHKFSLTKEDRAELKEFLVAFTTEFQWALKTENFTPNFSECRNPWRQSRCEFEPLCRSQHSAIVRDNLYQLRAERKNNETSD